MSRFAVSALAASWVALATAAHGQTAVVAPPVPTDATIRTLIETPSRVVVTRLSRLDPIPLADGGRLLIHAIGAFEPGEEDQRSLGIRIDLETSSLSRAQGRHYMDVHEIEGLLKGIFLLEEVASDARANLVSEADYETIEGFVIGVTATKGQVDFWVEGGRGERAHLGLARSLVVTLRQRLELARTRLFTE